MNKKSMGYVLGFTLLVCAFCGTGVATVHFSTLGLLEKNETLHRNRVICRAFLLEVGGNSAEAYAEAIRKHIRISVVQDGNLSRALYRRSDPGEEAVGFDFGGMGFWDRINGIVVLTPDLTQILNIQFFDHKETPGLGARIEEQGFTDQFKGLKVAWDQEMGRRVIIGASPEPDSRNRVDAITGATQTSSALMSFLNAELERIRNLELE
jgi:Na+-transporting NADH:ubiquinone oxidoreductase subunit C